MRRLRRPANSAALKIAHEKLFKRSNHANNMSNFDNNNNAMVSNNYEIGDRSYEVIA